MSKRASLPETVTDVLVERGDKRVFSALAKNAKARFSQSGFATLVKKSENDETLAFVELLRARIGIHVFDH